MDCSEEICEASNFEWESSVLELRERNRILEKTEKTMIYEANITNRKSANVL